MEDIPYEMALQEAMCSQVAYIFECLPDGKIHHLTFYISSDGTKGSTHTTLNAPLATTFLAGDNDEFPLPNFFRTRPVSTFMLAPHQRYDSFIKLSDERCVRITKEELVIAAYDELTQTFRYEVVSDTAFRRHFDRTIIPHGIMGAYEECEKHWQAFKSGQVDLASAATALQQMSALILFYQFYPPDFDERFPRSPLRRKNPLAGQDLQDIQDHIDKLTAIYESVNQDNDASIALLTVIKLQLQRAQYIRLSHHPIIANPDDWRVSQTQSATAQMKVVKKWTKIDHPDSGIQHGHGYDVIDQERQRCYQIQDDVIVNYIRRQRKFNVIEMAREVCEQMGPTLPESPTDDLERSLICTFAWAHREPERHGQDLRNVLDALSECEQTRILDEWVLAASQTLSSSDHAPPFTVENVDAVVARYADGDNELREAIYRFFKLPYEPPAPPPSDLEMAVRRQHAIHTTARAIARFGLDLLRK